MFNFELTEDFQYIKCTGAPSEMEYRKLCNAFKLYKKNAFMSPAVRHGFVDGRVSFINDSYMPIGLWGELQKYMDSRKFQYEIKGLNYFLNLDITLEEVTEFVDKLFEGSKEIENIRWYQYESIYRILRYRYSSQQVSTAAGKTMISYSVAAWLKNHGKVSPERKFLMIVPRAPLATQTKNKFELYKNGMVPMNVISLGDNVKFDQDKWDNADVVISTYQTLSNLPDDIFKSVKVINVDEAHTARTNSIKRVIKLASPLSYRFGLSGTLMVHMSNAEYYENLSNLGPVVFIYDPKDLISDGFAPEVNITRVNLHYDYDNYMAGNSVYDEYRKMRKTEEKIKEGKMKGSDYAIQYYKNLYTTERQMICSDEKRLGIIVDYLSKIDKKKNILVLFNDIKGDFGHRLHEKMSEFKETRYIDGSTDGLDRGLYLEQIEDKGVNLVASFGTFSTGIDLKNIHYIVFAESYKSPILIGQSIGRGLRNHKSKKSVNIIDFVDDMYKHTMKQAEERIQIYNKQKYSVKNIDLAM